MTSEERHKELLKIANTPIDDFYAYTVAAQNINAMIENARKVFGGLSTEAQFAEFTAQASKNLTGNEILLLAQFLNRFLFAGPLVDGGRTSLRKDVTIAELLCLKRAADFLQINFQINATALGMMRIFTKRAAGTADFWGMTPDDMEKELNAIAPQADMIDDFKKMVQDQFAAMGGKLDALQDMERETQAAAKKAANNSKAVLDELAQWREWVRGISQSGDVQPLPLPTLCAEMQKAVVAKWDEYKDGCAGKCRATFQGCLDTCAADYVYKSAATGKTYQLLELAPNEATLAAIVHNAQVKRSAQKKTKAAEKSKSRQNRKRK